MYILIDFENDQFTLYYVYFSNNLSYALLPTAVKIYTIYYLPMTKTQKQ